MSEATLAAGSERTGWFDRATSLLFHVGRVVFSLAIVALCVETLVCARYVTDGLGPQYKVIPVLPSLPAIPWLAYLFGAILVACGTVFCRSARREWLRLPLAACCFFMHDRSVGRFVGAGA